MCKARRRATRLVLTGLLAVLPLGELRADPACFARASDDYTQIYCQLMAMSKAQGLPPLHEFERSDDITKALLLKRPAESAGIALTLPAKSPPRSVAPPAGARPAPPPVAQKSSAWGQTCRREGLDIHCGEQHWQLRGNQHNSALAPNALDDDQRMVLPRFSGDRSSARELDAYLSAAYAHYLRGMLTIGLGGSVLSYGKFDYLFADLGARKVDFSERFETMYRYLKKDKRSLAVDTRVPTPQSSSLGDCYPIEEFVVCSQGINNLLYVPVR